MWLPTRGISSTAAATHIGLILFAYLAAVYYIWLHIWLQTKTQAQFTPAYVGINSIKSAAFPPQDA